MHIAICDDHFADRKQIERLLKKEAEIRKCTGEHLYVDSFGSAESLTHAPMIYDLFLIDLSLGKINGMDLTKQLRTLGVSSPVILCCSTIDYCSYVQIPENTLFLSKPIVSSDLSAMISTAVVEKKLAKKTIEIRGEQTTHYIHEENLLYAVKCGHTVKVYLEGGDMVTQLGDMHHLITALTGCSSFIIVGKETLINITHVRELKGLNVIMDDCKKIPLRFGDRGRIKEFMNLSSSV